MNAHGKNVRGALRKPHALSRVRPVAAACALLVMSQFAADLARANAGFGVNTNIAGTTIAVPTYFANSPQGWQPALDANNQPIINPATGVPYTAAEAYAANGNSTNGSVVPMIDTGTPLRKFVDTLAGAYHGLDGMPTANVPMGIPVAIVDKWVDASGNAVNGNTDDYYEIAAVEYVEQMHSDLPKQTRLRGYVQIETPNIIGKTDASGIVVSEHIPGKYLDGTSIKDAKGNQVYFVHAPHYLGPTIIASRGKAVRVLFHNYLPYTDAKTGQSVGSPTSMGGELPIPVDEYLAGGGPLTNANGTPMLDKNGHPMKFGQNRITVHFHGGDTPWTGDGTPHQWFAPANDIAWTLTDANHPNGLGRGDSFQNVPDMPDPGNGSQTLYFPNNQSGRLMFYHDHTSGLTRLNVYMGEAAGYVITDPDELSLVSTFLGSPAATSVIASGPLQGKTINSGLLDAVGIPLVLQDRTFVPKNAGSASNPAAGTVTTSTKGQLQSQDAKWNTQHWGAYGDLWFPHVYEVNQDPNAIDGTNPVGRWDWGPWFWPVFPSQYSLPSGNYGDVTTTPEAFVDTPIVNGQVYPTMTLDPKTYRFRILSVGNDRSLNLGLYMAVDAAGNICDANSAIPVVPNATAPGQTAAPANCTEVRMVPASISTPNMPPSWPMDGRAGGVPDPLTAGPDIVQIGNETGLLPTPAVWPAQPVTYDQNVRSMTIFNVLNHQLLLAPAERADVLVDFSGYAGKTLILYNDGPAPMPGFDPRIDYFSGVGDQTQGGGAYDTLPGYGPNTRTYLQIKINNTTPAAPLDVAGLTAALPAVYAKSRNPPLIPETAYNTVFPSAANSGDNYAHIFTGSSLQPAFTYPMRDANGAVVNGVQLGTVTPIGATGAVNATGYAGLLDTSSAITLNSGGSGYTTAPSVTFNPAPVGVNGAPAPTATATISGGAVTAITLNNMTNGYFASAPTITVGAPPVNVNASAVLTTNSSYKLAAQTINVSSANGGSGYVTAPTVSIVGTPTGGTASASATINGGKVTSVKITITGTPVYTTTPTLTIAGPAAETAAAATLSYTLASGNASNLPTTSYGSATPTVSINAPTSGGTASVSVTMTGTTNKTIQRITVTTTGTPVYAAGNPPVISINGAASAVRPSTKLVITPTTAGAGYTGNVTASINGTLIDGTAAPSAIAANLNAGAISSFSTTPSSSSAIYATGATVSISALPTDVAATATLGVTTTTADAVQVTTAGSGYITAPAVTFSPAKTGQPTATAVLTNGTVTAVNLSSNTYAFAAGTTVNIAAAPVNATATAAPNGTVPAMNRVRVINKAIQELFDPVYGRMNATLAVELPYSSNTVATTIPLAYVDTPVDFIDGIQDGETQIWKITHNGVDSHPVHFHLVNVQVINRVDWAGVVKPPEANEIGWKETLRMNPLEDVYVAVRAQHPVTPFGVPRSQRLLDPAQALNGQAGLTQIDPLTGAAPTTQTQIVGGASVPVTVTAYSNQLTDFDNEYVWHCHILGHEENDFMRPFIFHPTVVVPDAPGLVKVSGNTVTWTDPTPFGGYDAQGIPTAGMDSTGNPASSPKNEIGFRIYTTATATGSQPVLLATVPANTTSYNSPTSLSGLTVTAKAFNAAGESLAGTSTTADVGIAGSSVAGQAIASAGAAQLGLTQTAETTAAGNAAATNITGATATATATAIATATATAATDATLAAGTPAAPVEFSQVTPLGGVVAGAIVLHWANAPANVDATSGFTNVTAFTLSWTGSNGSTGTAVIPLPGNGAAAPTGATVTQLATGASYVFSLVATNSSNAATPLVSTAVTLPAITAP